MVDPENDELKIGNESNDNEDQQVNVPLKPEI